MSRTKMELLPEFSAELEEIRKSGINKDLLQKIIAKHQANAIYNRNLYERYMTLQEGVPIFDRQPRYDEDNPINNKINNDFFGEIVDFKTGYFAMKFKLHGLETKCGMYQAQMMNAAQYMWKLLSSVWAKKGIKVDPLQVTMDFKRNFPQDLASEAQIIQALIAAGLPKAVAYAQLSFVDDVDYIMQLIEDEKNEVASLSKDLPEDEDTETEQQEQASEEEQDNKG